MATDVEGVSGTRVHGLVCIWITKTQWQDPRGWIHLSIDMEATFAEYEEWSEDPIPESVIQNYNKALQQLEKYRPYEEALVSVGFFYSKLLSTDFSLIDSCK